MGLDLSLSAVQSHVISQNQIQSLGILSMDNIELNKLLENEYIENPLLEQYDNKGGGVPPQKSFSEENHKELPYHDSCQIIRESIMSQVNLNSYPAEEIRIIQILIDSLDKNGYFPYEEEDFVIEQNLDECTFKRCIRDLRDLEPYGIFSKNLKECLLKQLEMTESKDEVSVCLINNYLEELAGGKIAVISRATGYRTIQIRKCLQKIKSLNPRPLGGIEAGEAASYIVPDIIIRPAEEKGFFAAMINDNWMPDYGISDYYFNMMISAKNNKELKEYFEKKYQRAKFLISSIEQRRNTILRIADHVSNTQRDYFSGKGPKKAETMSDVAKELNIAVSTVSRAIKSKYIEHPKGSVFFKDLFSGSVSKKCSGEAKTSDEIKDRIKRLIEQEDKKTPLSDMAIVKILEQGDINISRRVIAKYREALGIKGSFERKILDI